MTESLGDAGVGNAVAVAVGGGSGVAVTDAGMAGDSVCVAQAARMNNPMNKMLDTFLKGNIMNSVIY
jgi:hypothetical protein